LGRTHLPVMAGEVTELLGRRRAVIDATVGAGGHAEALLLAGVGNILGLDRDRTALDQAHATLARFGDRVNLVQARFSELAEVARTAGASPVAGVLYDLGVSSMHLEAEDRGFSYRRSGPLDMRMGSDETVPTAGHIVNSYSESDLARIIFEYGEERFARRVARAIVRRRPLHSTDQLAAVVAAAVPSRRKGPHPARRTFQALRIEVNEELRELAASLPQAASLLERAGRLVVISYHSLEDRISKRFIASTPALSSLTRKPLRPTGGEMAANPRARSARLRAAEVVEAA
jgi:16S rRNA (cytosine1402-N4)-methyltransferase